MLRSLDAWNSHGAFIQTLCSLNEYSMKYSTYVESKTVNFLNSALYVIALLTEEFKISWLWELLDKDNLVLIAIKQQNYKKISNMETKTWN